MRAPQAPGARALRLAGLVVLCLVSGVAGALLLTLGVISSLASLIGVPARLDLRSRGSVNLHGGHVRLVGNDGNFEFEHNADVPFSSFDAYARGTGTRTPIAFGAGDGQDVVELIVRGSASGTSDLQQWRIDGQPVAAVDAKGRLRLGTVALSVELRHGRAVLVATVPGGGRQVLARGR